MKKCLALSKDVNPRDRCCERMSARSFLSLSEGVQWRHLALGFSERSGEGQTAPAYHTRTPAKQHRS